MQDAQQKRFGNLVLERRQGEAILIGEGPTRIIVHVAHVKHGKVKLAVSGPVETRIIRQELLDRPVSKCHIDD